MDETIIKKVTACQVFSGRGYPAIEATVVTDSGKKGTVQCVSGLSVGSHEVAFAYDGGSQWRGMGLHTAVRNIEEIIGPAIVGMDASRQTEVDHRILGLFGEDTKARLGGNAVAAVSAAVLKAGAEALELPLYRHIGGVGAVTLPNASYGCISGGIRYGNGKKSGSKPTYSFIGYGFDSFSEASYALWEIFGEWEAYVNRKWGLRSQEPSPYYTCCGFFSIPYGLVENDFVLWDSLTEIIGRRGYENKVGLQVDCAADCYYKEETRTYQGLFDREERTRDQQIDMILKMARDYPFVIIEDPLNENDYEGHAIVTEQSGIQIVGDDLFARQRP